LKKEERRNLEYAIEMIKCSQNFDEKSYRPIRRSMLEEGLITCNPKHGVGVVMEFYYDQMRTIQYMDDSSEKIKDHAFNDSRKKFINQVHLPGNLEHQATS